MKRIPTPISGLALAIASLGLLLEVVFPSNYTIQYTLALIASIFIILLTIKFIKYPVAFFNDLRHPVLNSVIPTYSMSLMAISKSIYNLNKKIGLSIWFFAIILHLFFLFMFLKEQKKIFKVENLIPSWFVPPVGIVVASVSLPDRSFSSIAQIIFWFGFIFYIILLPIMLNRVIFYNNIPTEKKPTIAIFAAPSSLCLAGYLNAFPNPNFIIVTFLFGMALLFTGTIYLSFYHILKDKFHYGFAALTFPMVISATALNMYSNWTKIYNINSFIMKVLLFIEISVAIIVVTYVFFNYLYNIYKQSIKQ